MRSLISLTAIVLVLGCKAEQSAPIPKPAVVIVESVTEPVAEPVEMAPQWMIDELLAELEEYGDRLDRLSDGYAKLLEETTIEK